MTEKEKKLRNAVHAAAEAEGDRISKANEGVIVPESLGLRIEAILAEPRERALEQSAKKNRRGSFNLRRAAAVAAALVVLLVAPLATKAGREGYLKISQKMFPQYVQFRIDDSASSYSRVPGISLSYVPREYKLVIDSRGTLSARKYYEKDEDAWFDVHAMKGTGTMNVDNSGAVIKQIYINGYPATIIVNEEHVSIVWPQDDVLIFIRGSLGEETMLRIAKGVRLT